jgi:hypothetical protein
VKEKTLVELAVDWRIKLIWEWVQTKYDVKVWTIRVWISIATSGWLFGNNKIIRFSIKFGNSAGIWVTTVFSKGNPIFLCSSKIKLRWARISFWIFFCNLLSKRVYIWNTAQESCTAYFKHCLSFVFSVERWKLLKILKLALTL